MSGVKMLVSALTDVGRARTTNEDAYAVTDLASGRQLEIQRGAHALDVQERGALLALSDGMGGHQAGEVASALVLESLQAALQETQGALHEQLEEAVQRANRSVNIAAQAASRHGMGATLTAVFVRGAEAYIAEVGDSRAYLLRNGRLRQITRDQSLVQLLVDQGVLTADEARRAPGKNVILQAMGLSRDVRVAIGRLELRRGDRFLLCSDGVSNAVSDDELRQMMTGSDPRAACETMIALANDRGGLDNQTAIVADLAGDDLEPPDEFETITSTYEMLKAYEATKGLTAAATAPAGAGPPVSGTVEDDSDVEIDADLPELPHADAQARSRHDDAGETQKLVKPDAGSKMMLLVILVALVVLGLVVGLRLAQ
jgi:serine/threonine protein phosphatase PrpC